MEEKDDEQVVIIQALPQCSEWEKICEAILVRQSDEDVKRPMSRGF
jgi:hypothetical protein